MYNHCQVDFVWPNWSIVDENLLVQWWKTDETRNKGKTPKKSVQIGLAETRHSLTSIAVCHRNDCVTRYINQIWYLYLKNDLQTSPSERCQFVPV